VTFAAATAGGSGLLLIGAAGAAWMLRRSWGDRTITRPWWIAAGWIGVAGGVQLREARARGDKSLAPEPSERPSKAWRGWLRAILAGPLGMIAAMGVAICYAVWAPGAPQTRLLIGGLLVPLLWGAAMAWTLADDKILRATAVLTGVTVVTFAASVLKGFS
jgi:hypothetical protein